MSQDNDKYLMELLLDGDEGAWDAVAENVNTWLVTSSRRHFMPEEEIEDLKHEILEKLIENNYEKMQQFGFRCRLSSWIGSIVNNHIFDHYQANIRRETRDKGFEEIKVSLSELEDCSEILIEKLDNQELVSKALEQMSPKLREVVKMHFWQDLMPKEIATITGERVSTVTSRLSRARESLKEILAGNKCKGGEI